VEFVGYRTLRPGHHHTARLQYDRPGKGTQGVDRLAAQQPLRETPLDGPAHAFVQLDPGPIAQLAHGLLARDTHVPVRLAHQVQRLPVDTCRGQGLVHGMGHRSHGARQTQQPQGTAERLGHGLDNLPGGIDRLVGDVIDLAGSHGMGQGQAAALDQIVDIAQAASKPPVAHQGHAPVENALIDFHMAGRHRRTVEHAGPQHHCFEFAGLAQQGLLGQQLAAPVVAARARRVGFGEDPAGLLCASGCGIAADIDKPLHAVAQGRFDQALGAAGVHFVPITGPSHVHQSGGMQDGLHAPGGCGQRVRIAQVAEHDFGIKLQRVECPGSVRLHGRMDQTSHERQPAGRPARDIFQQGAGQPAGHPRDQQPTQGAKRRLGKTLSGRRSLWM